MRSIVGKASKYSDSILAISIVGILLVLLFPVPKILLDLLLAISITISIIILMTTLFISKPLELNVFPTILLVTTMLRLSLNIASTRLILANGHTGWDAAGHIIEAFGAFVMQGNVVIGLIVFIILTLINFIVITKGSGRIAEVAARFSLDAMPGKQMAIDADLSSGLLSESEAKSKRKELEEENTFYGAMDGANKFVRGDAIAGIVITFVNLVGGIIIGVVQRGLTFGDATRTYTLLTIGDGLVSQIPALIISLAAGLLVTKSGIVGSADKAIFGQLSRYPQAMYLTSGVTILMATLPGLPFFPFFTLSGMAAGIGYIIQSNRLAEAEEEEKKKYASPKSISPAGQDADAAAQEDNRAVVGALNVDNIRIELGYNLISLIGTNTVGFNLPQQIKALRLQIAKEYGFVMPSVRIQDNLQLPNDYYSIKIKDIECGTGNIRANKLLVLNPQAANTTGFGASGVNLPGEESTEPTFGLPAKWIDTTLKEDALIKHYTVIDPNTVVTTHLTEIIKENIEDLLSYGAVQRLLDDLPEEHQKLVKDVIPEHLPLGALQRVLHNLLVESVSIKDLTSIIETTSDVYKVTRSVIISTEHVRSRLSKQICNSLVGHDGFITVITLSMEWERRFAENLSGEGDNCMLVMSPSMIQEFLSKMRFVYDEQAQKRGIIPALLTSPTVRAHVRSVVARFKSSVPVLSQNEIHHKSKLRTVGTI